MAQSTPADALKPATELCRWDQNMTRRENADLPSGGVAGSWMASKEKRSKGGGASPDGILDRFTLLSQSMIFLKVFFHLLHNTAGRAVATEAEFGTDCQ